LTVLSTLPTALVGGLASLLRVREPATLYAFVGMFMLIGHREEERHHDSWTSRGTA
jgi:multidrug efflux pump subunit AcrB